jgi:hypothetical protein
VLRLPTRQGGAVLVGAGVGIVVDQLGSSWWKTALIATFVASSLIALGVTGSDDTVANSVRDKRHWPTSKDARG